MDNNKFTLDADRIAEQCILEIEKLLEFWNIQIEPKERDNLKIEFKEIISNELNKHN